MSDFYGVKVFHLASSPEVEERIKWCKENNISFITRILRGITISVAGESQTFTEDKMTGMVEINGAKMDLSKMRAREIGIGFFFSKQDAVAFKLRWGGDI